MQLDRLFCPQSIAVIGASRDPKSVGGSIFHNIHTSNYTGTVTPINPHATEIEGKPCFASVSALPAPVDLAIIAVPAPIVPKVFAEVIAARIPSCAIISAGFGEAGEKGKGIESEITRLAKAAGVAVLGPNCLGLLNPHLSLNASFETVLPRPGSIALISQSGAIISALLDIGVAWEMGFSKVASVGNKAVLTEEELLPYLFADPQTNCILLYTESLRHADTLIHLCRTHVQQSNTPKPVIVLKAGKTEAGQKASSSHTGSLAGSTVAYEALLRDARMIQVDTIEELMIAGNVAARVGLPDPRRGVAIVTNAGGPGIVATDAAALHNIPIATLSSQTIDKLSMILPAGSHAANPVDVLGDATSERYDSVLHHVLADEQVGSAVVIVTPQTMTDTPQIAANVVRHRNSTIKPIITSVMGASQVDTGVDVLELCGVANTTFPEQAVSALGKLYGLARQKQSDVVWQAPTLKNTSSITTILRERARSGVRLVDPDTVFTTMASIGMSVPRYHVVQTPAEAGTYAQTLTTPVAIKIISPDITHKTDVGGVMLSVAPTDVAHQVEEMLAKVKNSYPAAVTHGVVIMEMVPHSGVELFIGLTREERLGTLVVFGFGGVTVEVDRDTVAAFAPISPHDARDLLTSLRGYTLLTGFRGMPVIDTEAFASLVSTVSTLAIAVPEISSLDCNPIVVDSRDNTLKVLDARINLMRQKA